MNLSAQVAVSAAADQQTHLVRGQVVNALNGSPVARALVTVNAHSALTDSQGRFEFAGISGGGPGAYVFTSVRKPGFSIGTVGIAGNVSQRITDLDAPVSIKLYPDALVSGVLTGRDGAPLPHVSVRLLRSQYDGASMRWVQAGFATTNLRGEYRISAPAGRFRVVSGYVQHSFELDQAILPSSFPQPSESTPLELRSGEERRVDLRARAGPVHPVTIHFDPSNTERMNANLTVSTSTGDDFRAGLSADQRLELPAGTYTLRAHIDNRDESVSGSSRVIVTAEDAPTATLHLAPDTQFIVELQAGDVTPGPTSNSSNTNGLPQLPHPQQLNLSLHNQLAIGDISERDIRLQQTRDQGSSFHVPPGRYRLTASGGGPWNIQSASVGSTDLLLDDLVVSSGSAGGTIRILVGNQTGTVHAHTKVPQGASAWMYLLPRGPSLQPIQPISLTSDGTGTGVASASVPAGPYTAVLMDGPLQQDPRDPAFLASFASGPTDIEVQPNEDTSFSLDLAQRKQTEP